MSCARAPAQRVPARELHDVIGAPKYPTLACASRPILRRRNSVLPPHIPGIRIVQDRSDAGQRHAAAAIAWAPEHHEIALHSFETTSRNEIGNAFGHGPNCPTTLSNVDIWDCLPQPGMDPFRVSPPESSSDARSVLMPRSFATPQAKTPLRHTLATEAGYMILLGKLVNITPRTSILAADPRGGNVGELRRWYSETVECLLTGAREGEAVTESQRKGANGKVRAEGARVRSRKREIDPSAGKAGVLVKMLKKEHIAGAFKDEDRLLKRCVFAAFKFQEQVE
ncbi:hypothetical protein B0H14DRAFT_2654837 [Mycena olivaceomarginata]|nr:hypothetical protein B0H14DRAFT_2654837 [Mycena olivaceomarginata]